MGKLSCGKHAGRTFEEVAGADKPYCDWVLRSGRQARPLTAFGKFLEKRFGGVLRVGRYKGSWFQKVIEEDPSYVEWAAELNEPGPHLSAFVRWSREQLGIAEHAPEPPPLKKPRNEEDAPTCKICFSDPVGCVLLPCGHTTCRRCSKNFKAKKCPFCREIVFEAALVYF